MVNKKLVNYIRENLDKGHSLGEIKSALVDAGWSLSEISEAVRLPYNSPEVRKRKIWWIVGAIGVFLLISIVSGLLYLSGMFVEVEDLAERHSGECYDMDCLISAAHDCSDASLKYTSNLDLFWVQTITTSFYEIEEGPIGCDFKILTEEQTVEYSDEFVQKMLDSGLTQEEVDEQLQESNDLADLVEGKGGTCVFNPNENLVTYLTKLKEGNVSGGSSCKLDIISQEQDCTYTGDLIDLSVSCGGELFN
tara:strand:- start:1600 stop:2349 length:750 start_codon:yes stop_codon:yes gene_type:complete